MAERPMPDLKGAGLDVYNDGLELVFGASGAGTDHYGEPRGVSRWEVYGWESGR